MMQQFKIWELFTSIFDGNLHLKFCTKTGISLIFAKLIFTRQDLEMNIQKIITIFNCFLIFTIK